MASDNRLWEKHRFILPGIRDLAIHRCRDCKFFVNIRGREETRKACVVNIKAFGNLDKRIPSVIPIMEIIKRVGIEGLEESIKCEPEAQSCGCFRLKPTKSRGKIPLLFKLKEKGFLNLFLC